MNKLVEPSSALPHEYLKSVEQLLIMQGAIPIRIRNGISLRGTASQSELTWHCAQGSQLECFRVVTVLDGQTKEAAEAFGHRINSFASIGALTRRGDNYSIESRLTMLEGENAGAIHIPLLAAAIAFATDTMLRSVACVLTDITNNEGISVWGAEDIKYVGEMLKNISFCNYDEHGLTAEFPLDNNSLSATAGDNNTAMLQISRENRHPDIGPGLFIVLQMPHRIGDEKELERVINALNQSESLPLDSPPHFGAWCVGASLGDNPSYVTFLPNSLHLPGIALNFAVWNFHRAQFAAAKLAALGVRS